MYLTLHPGDHADTVEAGVGGQEQPKGLGE